MNSPTPAKGPTPPGAHTTAELLALVDGINTARHTQAVDHAHAVVGDLHSARVAVCGAGFRPGVGDISDSSTRDGAARRRRTSARVRLFDPYVNDLAARQHPALTVADTAPAAPDSATLLMVLTDWPEVPALDPASLEGGPAPRTLIDARRCLDARRWQAAGRTHQFLGHHPALTGDSR